MAVGGRTGLGGAVIGAGLAVDGLHGHVARLVQVQGRVVAQLVGNGCVHGPAVAGGAARGGGNAEACHVALVAVGRGRSGAAVGVVGLACRCREGAVGSVAAVAAVAGGAGPGGHGPVDRCGLARTVAVHVTADLCAGVVAAGHGPIVVAGLVDMVLGAGGPMERAVAADGPVVALDAPQAVIGAKDRRIVHVGGMLARQGGAAAAVLGCRGASVAAGAAQGRAAPGQGGLGVVGGVPAIAVTVDIRARAVAVTRLRCAAVGSGGAVVVGESHIDFIIGVFLADPVVADR